ncbi:mannitol dehydrogenase family protein [Spongisporangium articulatum]|uniref:Mannitol-1-phosphate 5-dehydrogenase n=1 Tax=Spongisporangium articulatum TaxID=3362603 RepID=A0ABW8AKM7_9ACTN
MSTLEASTLPDVQNRVPVPGYDRSQLSVGIVHFGVGAFHRAHQAMYLDRLMNKGQALDWAICGVGLLPGDRDTAAAMTEQNGLYTLVEKPPSGDWSPRVIGSITEVLYGPECPDDVLARLCAPSTRIVSLTVTEGGYNINDVTGEFRAESPAVAADLVPGATPSTWFGFVVEALARRRAAGVAPFAVMSCDNVQKNGDVAHRAVAAFARLRDPDLAAWIEREVVFPNSMVDRITPATTDADRAAVAERYGVDDRVPVLSEDFEQWVLEDRFPSGRPPFEEVGVQVVKDVEPYELMKLRLLNAGHQALGYAAYLTGYRYVHEGAQDPLFADFLLRYMREEAMPTLQPLPGIDLMRYTDQLIERFSNEQVRDTLARINSFTSDRIPKFLLPVVEHQLLTGGPIVHCAAIIAFWARYAEGTTEAGEPIDIVDLVADRVRANAARQGADALAFLKDQALFGDLAEDTRFTAVYRRVLASVHENGCRATLENLASLAD